MWFAPVITTAPAAEPVTADDVRDYLRIDNSDYDGLIPRWIMAAREKVEKLTSTRLLTQTVTIQATDLGDLAQLPVAPAQKLVSLSYPGSPSSAWPDPTTYELVGAGLAWSVLPTTGVLPAQRVITAATAPVVSVELIVGYGDAATDAPASVLVAILETVRGLMNNLAVDIDGWLVDHRLWL